jgi:hypothetical protein
MITMGCQSHYSMPSERRPTYAAIFELADDPADVLGAMNATAESSVCGFAGLIDPFGGMLGSWAARKTRDG